MKIDRLEVLESARHRIISRDQPFLCNAIIKSVHINAMNYKLIDVLFPIFNDFNPGTSGKNLPWWKESDVSSRLFVIEQLEKTYKHNRYLEIDINEYM